MTKSSAEMWVEILVGDHVRVEQNGDDADSWRVLVDGDVLRDSRECFHVAVKQAMNAGLWMSAGL